MKPSYKLAFTILFALAMLFSGTNAETSLRKSQLISDSFSYSVSTHEVKDVFFLNATNGWMAVTDHTTDTGYLLATQDAGRTWRWFSTPPQIGRVFFTSPHHGWALRFVSDSSSAQTTIYLLSTKDGGEHWTSESDKPVVAVPTSKNGRITASMTFLNESHAWFVGRGSGASGYVLETTDGGQSFKTPSGLPPGLIGCDDVRARSDMGILIVCSDYTLLSVDNGKTWKSPLDPKALEISPQLFDMSAATFLDGGRGWLVGQGYRGNGTVLRTEDYGRSWRREFAADVATNFKSIWAIDNTHRCVVGYASLLFCSSDDGVNWNSRNVLPPGHGGQSNYFGNLVLLPSGYGWVVRYGGYLYRTTDAGQSWHEIDPLNLN